MLQRLKVKTMRYYPIYLDIQNRNCLVVGGGGVGTRKVATLLNCGAKVTAVSPDMSAKLRSLASSPDLTLKQRPYRSSDLEGMFLVIGATDDETLNRQISQDAEQRGTLCNIADRPEICNFILPAIVQREDLVITVSTSGKSPALAKKLRKSLEARFGEEYGILLKLMGAIRKKLLRQSHEPEAHKPIFEQLINSDLITLIKESKTAEINALLFDILGDGYRFDELIN
jgi:precorrin-2 dehydrogenase/sirohydrochlorin ferrochelatase